MTHHRYALIPNLVVLVAISGTGCAKSEAAGPSPAAASVAAPSSASNAAAVAAGATPSVPSAAVRTPSSEPPQTDGAGARFRVVGVAQGDVLNVREQPDAKSKKVYSFGPGVKSVRTTGRRQDNGGTPWIEVMFEGGTGWVNRLFLSETPQNGGCGDPALLATIRAFMRAVAASDGPGLKAVSSPLRGLSVRPESRVLKFRFDQVDTLFSSPAVLNLGPGPGGGPDLTGTFKARIMPALHRAVAGKGSKEVCGRILTGSSTSLPPTLENYAGYTPVSFHHPGDEVRAGMDWVTWVGSIEYVDGKPYFAALDQYQWEP